MNNNNNSNQNNAFGGFNFDVNQNQNNNKANDDVFEEVKENGAEQQKPPQKGGLSSLLDSKLVNLDLLGPKKQTNNNDFNNYW